MEIIAIDPYLADTISKVSAENVFVWILIAGVFALATYVLYRNGKLKATAAIAVPVLAFYIAFVLTITMIEREVTATQTYNLSVFWTYRAIADGKTDLIMEIVWNIVLFIPIGVLINYLIPIKYFWISIISSLFFSAGIEFMQLVLRRGLFEFDDMIHNTVGAMLGIVIFAIVSLAVKKFVQSSQK